jgi:hypothetical protein
VFLEQLDRPHRIVREGSLANRPVEDSLEELEIVIHCGNGTTLGTRRFEIFHVPRRDSRR